MSIAERIRARAFALGFDQVGFAPAEPPRGAEVYARWLAAGMQAEMTYMAREPNRRMDPRVFWPEARSIIAVSLYYGGQADLSSVGSLEGKVARYAHGDDYHAVMKKRLRELGHFLEEVVPGTRGIAIVDTSAFLERAHAVRAGLGWFGKNSMLLSQALGSYTLLGFVLTNLELPYDTPVTDHCGRCTRCLEACPTRAIPEPGVVDARRCISYLTIEHRGDIPQSLRPELQGWLFGCDICQEVCPWVRRAERLAKRRLNGTHATEGRGSSGPESSHQSHPLNPRRERAVIPLVEALLEPQEAFSARWRKSPVKRSKRRGLARNAAVLLGNSSEREAVIPALIRGLEDPEPVVRRHVAWALARHGGALARGALLTARAQEEDDETARAIGQAVAEWG